VSRGRLVSCAIILLPLATALACGGPDTGPTAIHYDRDECERCRMAISDPRFAAQVRVAPGKRPALFDDLGCALLWLDEQEAGGGEPPSEIWVREAEGADWLDARKAHFHDGHHTPMNFGFGASANPLADAVPLAEVRKRVREQERERRTAGH
jgi:copper chaperone NosL